MGIVVLQCSCCGKSHAIQYTAKNVLSTVKSGWNSFGSALYCPDCVKTWEDRNGAGRPLWGEDHTIERIDELYKDFAPKTVTAYCPECESENTFVWNVDNDGYKTYCAVCGSRLMLCDECKHRTGKYVCDCDYDSITDTCRFDPEGF